MRRSRFFSLISVASLALGVGVLIGNNPTSVVRLSPESLPEASQWRSGVHLIHNGWFVWRDAPYGDLFNGAEVLIPAAIAWLSACGFLFLIDPVCRRVASAGWLLVGFTAAAILFGRDPIAWSCLAGTMTAALAFGMSSAPNTSTAPGKLHHLSSMEQNRELRPKLLRVLPAIHIALLIAAAVLSRQFFPVSLILALAMLPATAHRTIPRALWGAVALVSVVVVMTTPSLPPLDYPVDGRVTDWSEATEMARPLVGPHAPIPVVAIRAMQRRLAFPLLMMASVSALGLRIKPARATATVALITSLLALWDTIPVRSIQESSPLLALGRLFPHGTTYPIAWFLAGSAAIVLGLAVVRARSAWLSFLWIGATSAIIFLDSQLSLPPPPMLSGRLYAQLAPQVLFSPSRLVIEENERAVLAMLRHRDATSRPLAAYGARITASANTSGAQLLLSPSRGQRWSPGGGVQRGNEWLAIRLAAPQPLVGVALSSGAYATDFARGIFIAGTESCPDAWLTAPVSQPASLRPLVRIDHWMGPLLLTPTNLPYYGPLPTMTIYFPRETKLQCLFMQQTGRATNDWSLTSVELLVPGKG